MSEIFVSYSWDSPAHEKRVLSLVNHLRTNGFDATLDKAISQQETAINFIKMMHQSMLEHPKIIVILSAGYKQKAETFTGNVGEEFQLLLNDIASHPKKYILVSFKGRGDQIVPFGLKGREVVDLSKPEGDETLFRKLSEQDKYQLHPVGTKPTFEPETIDQYTHENQADAIEILAPLVSQVRGGSQGGKYSHVGFHLNLSFKNITNTSIDGFAYEIKLKEQLVPKSGWLKKEGYATRQETITNKLFPKATIQGEQIELTVNSGHIHQIIGSMISISVYTDSGMQHTEFKAEELLKVKIPNRHGEPVPLSLDLF